MKRPSPSHAFFVLLVSTALVLSGCASTSEGASTGTGSTSGSDGGDSGASTPDDGASGTSGSAMDRAAADGMPSLGLSECPELEEYEYRPSSGNTQWFFSYVCPSRDAYDASVAAVLAQGYDESVTAASTVDYLAERNHLQAAANGGSTEVQLSITGSPDELTFEIYVTLTLP